MSDPHEWADVDAADDAAGYVEYLDEMTELDEVQDYKQRSHQLLELSDGNRVLDVGCGTGDDVLMLAKRVGPRGRAVGIDNSDGMIGQARARADDIPWVSFENGDAHDLSFPDDSFDAVRTDRVLQHLEHPSKALSELVRVTRPGGRVCVCEPDLRTIILDTPGGHSEEYLSIRHSMSRNPTIGGQLYRRLRNQGIEDVELASWVPTITSFEFFREGAMLDEWTAKMLEDGIVTEKETDEWYEALEDADERGRFFYAATLFIAAGNVSH